MWQCLLEVGVNYLVCSYLAPNPYHAAFLPRQKYYRGALYTLKLHDLFNMIARYPSDSIMRRR
jgi:hypothetical protein